MTKTAILYCSTCRKPDAMMRPIRERLQDQARRLGMMTVAVTCRPVDGFDVRLLQHPGKMPLSMFDAWKIGLSWIPDGWVVYNADDDCLYPDEHFRLHLPSQPMALYGGQMETYNYDLNVIYLSPRGLFQAYDRGSISNSQAWARRDVMADCVERKIAEAQEYMAGRQASYCYEPAGGHGYRTNHTRAAVASIDIRGVNNTTWTVPTTAEAAAAIRFQWLDSEPGWPSAGELIRAYGVT